MDLFDTDPDPDVKVKVEFEDDDEPNSTDSPKDSRMPGAYPIVYTNRLDDMRILQSDVEYLSVDTITKAIISESTPNLNRPINQPETTKDSLGSFRHHNQNLRETLVSVECFPVLSRLRSALDLESFRKLKEKIDLINKKPNAKSSHQGQDAYQYKEPDITPAVRKTNRELLKLCKPLRLVLKDCRLFPENDKTNDGDAMDIKGTPKMPITRSKKNPEEVVYAPEREAVFYVIKENLTKDIDIFCIVNGWVNDFKSIKGAKDTFDMDPLPHVKNEKNITNVCCWYNRNKIISALKIHENLKHFMMKPHACPRNKCKCCCRPISSSGSRLKLVATLTAPEDIEIDNLENEICQTYYEMSQKGTSVVDTFDKNTEWLIDLLEKFKSSEKLIAKALRYEKEDNPKAEKSINEENTSSYNENTGGEDDNLESLQKNSKQLYKKCCWYRQKRHIYETNNATMARFLMSPHTCPLGNCTCCCKHHVFEFNKTIMSIKFPAQNKKSEDTTTSSSITTTNKLNNVAKKYIPILPKSANSQYGTNTPNPNLVEVDTLISTILDKFKDVRLTINADGKVAAALKTPINTLSNAELKVLSNILKHAQEQVDALGLTNVTSPSILGSQNLQQNLTPGLIQELVNDKQGEQNIQVQASKEAPIHKPSADTIQIKEGLAANSTTVPKILKKQAFIDEITKINNENNMSLMSSFQSVFMKRYSKEIQNDNLLDKITEFTNVNQISNDTVKTELFESGETVPKITSVFSCVSQKSKNTVKSVVCGPDNHIPKIKSLVFLQPKIKEDFRRSLLYQELIKNGTTNASAKKRRTVYPSKRNPSKIRIIPNEKLCISSESTCKVDNVIDVESDESLPATIIVDINKIKETPPPLVSSSFVPMTRVLSDVPVPPLVMTNAPVRQVPNTWTVVQPLLSQSPQLVQFITKPSANSAGNLLQLPNSSAPVPLGNILQLANPDQSAGNNYYALVPVSVMAAQQIQPSPVLAEQATPGTVTQIPSSPYCMVNGGTNIPGPTSHK